MMAEDLFEMSDDIKLQELGYDSNFDWSKSIFKKDGNVRLDYFKAYIDGCDTIDKLEMIDYLKFDDNQREYWKERKTQLEEDEVAELTRDPHAEMYEAEPEDTLEIKIEDKKGKLIDVDDYHKTIELNKQYINEVKRLRNELAEFKEKSRDAIQMEHRNNAIKEIGMLLGKNGIKATLTPETMKILKELSGK